ncbi:hypothetical protein DGG96_00930 [Legionella qingyii]|uniref:EAL domain-containing protein n=1 Tax=Legionella qingyii TaxID=2184757 RepID=A0A317UBG0_9GAMM|nr:EAL domain-containing protein [Legionella qingyii]PWY57690.1 hypothetical protein DGG96_00930 [Legionella qingyii]RUR25843.1 EAL domain-containing protein [Legionella qingyii]
MKNTALICTKNNRLASLVAPICQSCDYKDLWVKNAREISNTIETEPIKLIILDTALQEPCIIDVLYILSNVKCGIPIIVLGDCEDKVLLSIKRIGELKELYIYTLQLNSFSEEAFREILHLIDKKSQIINEETIALALEKKQFFMNYQPKIELSTYKLVGVEALIRWQRPNHGLVQPDLFIPIAEKTGLIIPMTYWVIQEVFRQYAAWKRKGIQLKFAINLSANILTNIILPDELGKLMKEYKVCPEDICFEITEAAAMHWPDIVLEVLTRIRLKGFSLSIDDFGTGYSSLVELQRLPFTELKIDRSFIGDVAYNKSNMHIVGSIIGLGKNMNLTLIAEGVETKEAADKLLAMGCESIQGYLVSKPLSESEFLSWYRNKIDKNGVFTG